MTQTLSRQGLQVLEDSTVFHILAANICQALGRRTAGAKVDDFEALDVIIDSLTRDPRAGRAEQITSRRGASRTGFEQQRDRAILRDAGRRNEPAARRAAFAVGLRRDHLAHFMAPLHQLPALAFI